MKAACVIPAPPTTTIGNFCGGCCAPECAARITRGPLAAAEAIVARRSRLLRRVPRFASEALWNDRFIRNARQNVRGLSRVFRDRGMPPALEYLRGRPVGSTQSRAK